VTHDIGRVSKGSDCLSWVDMKELADEIALHCRFGASGGAKTLVWFIASVR